MWVNRFFQSQEQRFFGLFIQSAQFGLQAAQAFLQMVEHPEESAQLAQKIREIEHQADLRTHETVDLLHQSFLTPIDRDDIHELISQLDDVVDCIDAASERSQLYQIKEFPPEAKQLAQTCVLSAQSLLLAIQELPRLKGNPNILKHCVEVNRIENEADQILRAALARIFSEETDIRTLIKIKEVVELLETVTDRCEDVANTLESIVLEYS